MPISPLADSNVRSGPSRGVETRLGLRPSRLAHLLLLSSSILRAPAAPVALFLTMLSTSACIIPVGPDFQNPIAGPNNAPYIIGATPDFGAIVTPPQLTFSVTVTDPNIGDDLYVRWLADYPGANYRPVMAMPSFVAHSTNGQPLRASVSAIVDCVLDNLAMTSDGEHRVEVIVADRPFVDPVPPDTRLDLVMDPGLAVHASWVLEQLSCPSSPTP